MKISELRNILEAIEKVKKIPDVKFSYALLKNKTKIEKEIEVAEEVLKEFRFTQEEVNMYKDYDSKRVGLASKHARKDKDGKPKQKVIPGDTPQVVFDIIDEEKFQKDLDKLRKDFSEVIKKRDDINKKIDEVSNMEVEIDFYKIEESNLPSQLTLEQLEGIKSLISD